MSFEIKEWTKGQKQFLEDFYDWVDSDFPKKRFVLSGPAGTGKTSVVKEAIKILDNAGYTSAKLAFTGKAANVLRRKGISDARTMHSKTYIPVFVTEDGDEVNAEDSWKLRGKVIKKIKFERVTEIIEDVIFIDEYSTLSLMHRKDLEYLNKPILWVGDPLQLPPVNGEENGLESLTDVWLDEITRQAENSYIIQAATRARMGDTKKFKYGIQKNESSLFGVIKKDNCHIDRIAKEYSQVLVGTNKTKELYNFKIRKLLGFNSEFPLVGEKLICLSNDRELNVYNGQHLLVEKIVEELSNKILIKYKEDEIDTYSIEEYIHKGPFLYNDFDYKSAKIKGMVIADFAYAITVHKAQGSEWESVLLFDEGYFMKENYYRWLYTGITRAEKKLVLVR